MAFPVEEEEIAIIQPPVKTRIRNSVQTIIKTKLPPALDSLVILTIAGWYFFFTGLAILFGRDIPKEWLKIATRLTKGKVAKRINDMSTEMEQPQKKITHRVVDLDTRQPIL